MLLSIEDKVFFSPTRDWIFIFKVLNEVPLGFHIYTFWVVYMYQLGIHNANAWY